ncbi:MAG: hypothetical protein QGG25_18340, partial [Phycisphaerae bacterium]|nr:hypothetical protein [Phycisphaerae bacterium]
QPVLDKHCVKCHEKNKDNKPPKKRPPQLGSQIVQTKRGSYMNPRTKYFESYLNLAPKYGFYNYGGKSWSDPKWYRTTPGEFGAKASPLYQMLSKGHNKVKLSPEEMRRITVWLDSCSPFYGVYEKEGGEAQLRGEIAKPTLE